MTKRKGVVPLVTGLALAIGASSLGTSAVRAQETLNVCHGGHPIMVASQKILDKWAKKEGVKLATTLIAYDVYVPKVTQMLTTGSAQCDIIWHNDDWGQLWHQYLTTTDDVVDVNKVSKQALDAFWNDQRPEVMVRCEVVEPPGRSSIAEWNRAMTDAMRRNADVLRDAVIARDASAFESVNGRVLSGRINPAYDLWLRLRGKGGAITQTERPGRERPA